MSRRASRWRWALYGAAVLGIAATAVFFLSAESPTLQTVALCVFVPSAVVYVAARIATIVEERAG